MISTQLRFNLIEIFKHSPLFMNLQGALKNENIHQIRQIVERAMDDTYLQLDEEIQDDGDLLVYNAKVRTKKKLTVLYTEIIEIINNNSNDGIIAIKHLDRAGLLQQQGIHQQ